LNVKGNTLLSNKEPWTFTESSTGLIFSMVRHPGLSSVAKTQRHPMDLSFQCHKGDFGFRAIHQSSKYKTSFAIAKEAKLVGVSEISKKNILFLP